jgi:hypothetical protein
VCGVEMTIADADLAVPTDEGLVHGECYEGEAPATITEWKEYPQAMINEVGREKQIDQYRRILGMDRGRGVHHAIEAAMQTPDHEGSERLADEMERIERGLGGRYDDDGYGF